MVEITLTYNPYTKEKMLERNGIMQNAEVIKNLCGAEGTELSEWCGRFYSELLEKENDSFSVTFNGIQRDYEFMEDALKEFLKLNSSEEVKLIGGKIVQVQDRLQDLRNLFEKMQNDTPFEQLKSEELKRNFDRATNSEFEMAVVATMSSGKSTLINAILGRELLPARNEATTATIAKIYDIDGAEHFKGQSYDESGNSISEMINPLTEENMEELNNIDKAPVSEIKIWGDIPGIESKSLHLVLNDTPGTNNSRTQKHLESTMRLLNEDYKPMIIYVLNGTQLETNDDSLLLGKVKELVEKGDRQSRDRFIFVLSKADEFNFEKGETISRMIDKTKNYLETKHQIMNPRIFPVAARLAKEIRQTNNSDPNLTRKEKSDVSVNVPLFIEEPSLHFSDYADFLSPATKKELEARIKKVEAAENENELALLYTGVPSIELAISEYLTKYALPTKISEGVYSFKDKIDALNIEAQEKENLKGNEKKVEELKIKLEKIKSILERGDKAKDVQNQIKGLSTENRLKEVLGKARSSLSSKFTDITESMRNDRISVETAKAYMDNLKLKLPSITADFSSSVEKVLDDVLLKQAEKCVKSYQQYVEDLIGSVGYELPSASILGDVASITVNEVLNDYIYQDDVKVGSHQEKNRGFRAGLARLFGINRFLGKDAYENIDEYEKQDFVNFSKWIDEKIFPQIEKFEKETRYSAQDWAKKQEAEFKEVFLNKFEKLNDAIKEKIAEKENALQNQKQFEEMIEQNKKNLEWLDSLKKELDSILTV